jgi:hypothetical protein
MTSIMQNVTSAIKISISHIIKKFATQEKTTIVLSTNVPRIGCAYRISSIEKMQIKQGL